MKVYVIDNGGQWTHREWRVLKYLNVDAKIVPNNTPAEDLRDADALVLSGGAPSISYEKQKLGNQGKYLDELNVPILGICVGAQFIAEHFGGRSSTATYPEYGKTEIFVDEIDELFVGLPEKFVAWESHNDEIKDLGAVMTMSHRPARFCQMCCMGGFHRVADVVHGDHIVEHHAVADLAGQL